MSTQLPTAGSIGGSGGAGMGGLLYRITVPATGADEIFMLYVPDSPAGTDSPLLTCFHGFGSSHLDIYFNTDLVGAARRRGWFLLAPIQSSAVGDSQISFASAQSQENVSAALQFVLTNFDVDLDRIYGLGFSMGGGNALSFAARHRDRSRGAFAAVINHTGSISLADVYSNVTPPVQTEMRLLFGGMPTQAAFEYQRSSLVEVDSVGSVLIGGRHMATNLARVPIRSYYNVSDPLQYLVQQTRALDAFMGTLPGSTHDLVAVQAGASCGHCWDTLDEDAALSWLAQQSLSSPADRGKVLADREGTWGPFTVEPTISGAFASFDYAVDLPQNSLSTTSTVNLSRVELRLDQGTLDPTVPLEWISITSDGLQRTAEFVAYPQRPSSVTRNGAAIVEDCSPAASGPSWCYDGSTQTLSLRDPGSPAARWTIQP